MNHSNRAGRIVLRDNGYAHMNVRTVTRKRGDRAGVYVHVDDLLALAAWAKPTLDGLLEGLRELRDE